MPLVSPAPNAHRPFLQLIRVVSLVSFIGISLSASRASAEEREPYTKNFAIDSGLTLVTVNDSVRIGLLDLINRLDTGNVLADNGGVVDSAECYDTLNTMIYDLLFSFAADTFSLRDDSLRYGDYLASMETEIMRLYSFVLVDTLRDLDSVQLEKVYYNTPEVFTAPSHLDFSHIIISPRWFQHGPDSMKYAGRSEAEYEALARDSLRALASLIHDSASFAHTAQSYSMDAIYGENGGYVGKMRLGTLHSELEKFMYDSANPVGQILGPVRSRDGMHLLFIHNRFFLGIPPLSSDSYFSAYSAVLRHLVTVRARRAVEETLRKRRFVIKDSLLSLPASQLPNSNQIAIATGKNLDTVTAADFHYAAFGLNPPVEEEDTLTLATKRDIVHELMGGKTLKRLARESGVDSTKEYRIAERIAWREYSRRAMFFAIDREIQPPDSARITNFYETHKEEYSPSKPYHIMRVVTKDSLEAEYVYRQAEGGADLFAIAQEVGNKKTRPAAYVDPGFIGDDFSDTALVSQARNLLVRSVTQPFRSADGFCVAKLVDRKDVLKPSEAAMYIRGRLIKEDREAALARLKEAIYRGSKISFETVRFPGVLLPKKIDRTWRRFLEMRQISGLHIPNYGR